MDVHCASSKPCAPLIRVLHFSGPDRASADYTRPPSEHKVSNVLLSLLMFCHIKPALLAHWRRPGTWTQFSSHLCNKAHANVLHSRPTCQPHWVLNRWVTNSHPPHFLCQYLCPFLLSAIYSCQRGKDVCWEMRRVQRGNAGTCRSPTISLWVFKLIDGWFPEPCCIIHHAFLNLSMHSSSKLGQGCKRWCLGPPSPRPFFLGNHHGWDDS